jgi:hypothetical protein
MHGRDEKNYTLLGKEPFGRHKSRREDNIEINPKEIW